MATTKTVLHLSDDNNSFDVFSVTVETSRVVEDQWFKDLQDYISANLPAEITWSVVHKGGLFVQDPPREIEPNA